MLALNAKQGSPAWHAARIGIPTASNFSRILTSRGAPSAQAAGYLYELLDEYFTHSAAEYGATQWMHRGAELEPAARRFYAKQTGMRVQQIGLVFSDERRLIAASPDGLVGNDGLLEIKCPKLQTHVDWLLKRRLPSMHIAQVQGQLWVSGRRWCDFLSYHPDCAEQFLLRVARDEEYIKKLRAAVGRFVAKMLREREAAEAALQWRQ